MIHFDREAWTTLVYWEGGILREIVRPSSVYLLYLVTVVVVERMAGNIDFHIEKSALGMIMSFLVFLLVFRVNSTHSSHRHTALEVNQFFCTIESLIEMTCTSLRGPDGADPPYLQRYHAEMALLTKLNVIRMSLAYAISLVFHASLITAVTEMQGELDEASLQDLVFLRHRLQGLLYAPEMCLVDQAISIVQEEAIAAGIEAENPWLRRLLSTVLDCEVGPVYRGEACRYRKKGELDGQRVLLGLEAAPDSLESSLGDVSILPLPKVIMPMLLLTLKKPMLQPWGYSDRVWGLFSKNIFDMKSGVAVIDTMCTTPTPLPYVQLSHILVLIFAVFYPLTIDVEAGLIDTILMPFLIYATIQGFETLAKMLETATGHDVTDLNFFELIHNLEVQAKHAFESTEMHHTALDEAFMLPTRSFASFISEYPEEKHSEEVDNLPKNFDAYFHWLPMPSAILESLLHAHGHADALWQIERCKRKASLRSLLRVAMKRVHAGRFYSALEARPDEIKSIQSALEFIRQDPNLFGHYVVFAGVYDPNRDPVTVADSTGSSSPETKGPGLSHTVWKQHVKNMLEPEEHRAVTMFGGGGEESARSVLATFRDVELDCEAPDTNRREHRTRLAAALATAAASHKDALLSRAAYDSPHRAHAHPQHLAAWGSLGAAPAHFPVASAPLLPPPPAPAPMTSLLPGSPTSLVGPPLQGSAAACQPRTSPLALDLSSQRSQASSALGTPSPQTAELGETVARALAQFDVAKQKLAAIRGRRASAADTLELRQETGDPPSSQAAMATGASTGSGEAGAVIEAPSSSSTGLESQDPAGALSTSSRKRSKSLPSSLPEL